VDDQASTRPFSIVPERAAAAAARKVKRLVVFMQRDIYVLHCMLDVHCRSINNF